MGLEVLQAVKSQGTGSESAPIAPKLAVEQSTAGQY
jgi:hypothetical protein